MRRILADGLRVAKNFRMSDGRMHSGSSDQDMKQRLLWVVFSGFSFAESLWRARYMALHAPNEETEDNGYSQIAKFAKAIELLRQDYVDGNKTSYDELITSALKGMLSSLDPHSQYMDPNDFRDMQDDTRSRFNGLGIEVSMKNGLPTVVTPMEDTPAGKAGILSGDQILRINGTATDKMELQDAVNLLRGSPGQKVTLTLLRPSTKEVKELRARTRGDQSAERERRSVTRSRSDWAVQGGLCSPHPIQRADRG